MTTTSPSGRASGADVGVCRAPAPPRPSAPSGRRRAPGPAGSACRCSSAAWRASCAPARRRRRRRPPRPGTRRRDGCCPRRRWPATRSKAAQSTAGSFQTAVDGVDAERRPGRPAAAASRRAGRGTRAPRRRPGGGRGPARPGGAAQLPMGKWQATWWPGAISRISGTSSAQRASARGQRVRKRQPDGGLIGLGGSPGQRRPCVRGASGSGSTAEASRAAV